MEHLHHILIPHCLVKTQGRLRKGKKKDCKNFKARNAVKYGLPGMEWLQQ